ncbi:pre-mRNA-splicing regulator WTAP-like [Uloborus diversus]|uniref:pre-mRNA-splicing regulator WTAP-like n=1 Tax=Uloborus diversus TaxID=327109 RepID=UPI00240A88D6|nr:pre-mRNA-splicing regulator WTAP-like [Uloborus diversus]
MAAKKQTITRVRIAREELEKMTKEDFQKCWVLQEQYVDQLENKLNSNNELSELLSLRESEEKMKLQQLETARRENILVMRLTTKEQEMQEYAGQIQELKQAQVPTIAQLRSALLDPAVNLLFERMRKEMDTLKASLEETQNELSAWKFTPDSNTGKRLMAKCRLLYQENEELGKIISSGRMAKLEGDLALQKSFSEEMKKSQSELDEFLLELDEDVEGMQSTIYYLQQQLREAKDQILQLQKEKEKHLDLPNGTVSDHKLLTEETMDISSQSSSLPLICETNESNSSSLPVTNGTKCDLELTIKKEPNCHEIQSSSDTKEQCKIKSETKIKSEPMVDNDSYVTSTPEQKELPKDLAVSQESVIQSVIVQNKCAVTNEKLATPKERTNSILDGLDNSPNRFSRTNEHTTDTNESTEEKRCITASEDTVKRNVPVNSNKRTSEGGRGRKRTRPRTPVEPEAIKEESLPVRKRTRRREAESRQEVSEDSKRTQLEIDTDTEVQVAQTLAYWASAKQERTDIQSDPSGNALGNGEISKRDSEDK